jgi:hypothetical protein
MSEPPPPPFPPAPPAGVEVTLTYRAMAFMLDLVRTRVVIDGMEHRQKWGNYAFPLGPGHHGMEISFPWTFFRRAGRNSVGFDLAVGQVRRFEYTAPFFLFQKGPIRELTPEP